MAAELKSELGVDADLHRGSGGIFQVAVDDQVVAERSFLRFPTTDEIVDAVAKALGK